ncbi:MAG: sensor histidine kinase [Myxococcota bacterium]|nr:sensor histidine kinase [Myxococcota bacterium]
MQLSQFIRGHHQEIIDQWESFASTLLPAAVGMSSISLRDHAEELLTAIEDDLKLPQNPAEQAEKSKGRGGQHRMEEVGKAHAALRIADGFSLSQLVAEYRALRASVLLQYEKSKGADVRGITRFNEAIDEALVEATNRYMVVMDRTRDQFLAILGHDLRNPLGAIMMSAAMMSTATGEERRARAAARVLSSAGRIQRMVEDLLDLTRSRLGGGIPITPRPMDLEVLAVEIVAELQAFHPERPLEFSAEGTLTGEWDPDRLSQVLSNLVGNALQYGAAGRPIQVSAREEGGGVTLQVNNQGPPIPRSLIGHIFEPMTRNEENGDTGTTSLGLGLYIARQIVLSHEGMIEVTSTEREGTTFTVHLPRRAVATPPLPPPAEPLDKHDEQGDLLQAKGSSPLH